MKSLVNKKSERGKPADTSKPETGHVYALRKLPSDFRQTVLSIKGNSTVAGVVREFVRSIVEERKPAIGAVAAANWCTVGICARDSALAYAKVVEVPRVD